MSLLEILFGAFRKNTGSVSKVNIADSPADDEALKFMECMTFINALLSRNDYIARSEYSSVLEKYKSTMASFEILISSGMLKNYCKKNGLKVSDVMDGLQQYKNIISVTEKHNEAFLKQSLVDQKEYLDTILKDVDPVIQLDEDQRKVILTDEDYCLVIAGAGAGKTTTVAAKVKYLVEKKNIDPKQILVISFTNKAVQELREKINGALNIRCPISTFHSVGNAVLHKNAPDEKLNIVDDTKLYYVIQDYFRSTILQNESAVNNLILFFASYFDAPYEGTDINGFFNKIAKTNYTTMRGELEEFKREIVDTRTKKKVTIQNEILRSAQEVEIANFLYLNGIDYEYEPLYKYNIQKARKPYTPDFVITQGDKTAYIEHFGISEDGTNTMYSAQRLEAYKKSVNEKILLHRQHGTVLLYTFSSYNDKRPLTQHLKEQLEANGFIPNPRANSEIIEKLVTGEENRYIRKLVSLICRFISNFKTNGFTGEDFARMYHSTQNVRTKLFLNICNECYLEYERFLRENNAVDFQDMINESARLLREVKAVGDKLDFKYIIVDEYQDISQQRFDLTKTLADVTEAKIIAVGDDWQSIYAFSGSDITLFTQFEQKMGYAKMLKIVKTYRNSQEVIDIAGNFIQKNSEQIRKTLKSPKTIEDPVIIYTYDSSHKQPGQSRKEGVDYQIACAVETALNQIMLFSAKENKKVGTVLLLGRFGFDGHHLERTGKFEFINRGGKIKSVKYPKMDITFMTAHASKGLGYDNVIVLNGRNETYGFPSKIEDDPVLSFVIHGDDAIEYAEERRLFYVAMTRTKNRVYFIAPEQNPSEFLLEIKREYKNVVLRGQWNEKMPRNISKKTCPLCGYPLQFKYKNSYGLRLYMCTNEPEVCSFMTNEYSAGKLSVLKCDKCRDGYLIVKKAGTNENKNQYFLGCTNYRADGKGCNNTMSRDDFYELMGYDSVNAPEVHKNNYDDTARYAQIPGSRKENTTDDYLILKPEIKSVMYNGMDLNDIMWQMLQTLVEISSVRFYGADVWLDVLQGHLSKPIKSGKLDNAPGFGALKNVGYDDLMVIADWMQEQHLIIKSKGTAETIHITSDGLNYDKYCSQHKLFALRKRLYSVHDQTDQSAV